MFPLLADMMSSTLHNSDHIEVAIEFSILCRERDHEQGVLFMKSILDVEMVVFCCREVDH